MICDEYLRSVDVCVVFANGEVLLVSEREADRLLRGPSQRLSKRTHPCVAHLAYIRHFHDSSERSVKMIHPRDIVSTTKCQADMLTAIQLFNAETTYSGRKAFLKELITKNGSEPGKLVQMRGKWNQMALSDLEKACKQTLQEQGEPARFD